MAYFDVMTMISYYKSEKFNSLFYTLGVKKYALLDKLKLSSSSMVMLRFPEN